MNPIACTLYRNIWSNAYIEQYFSNLILKITLPSTAVNRTLFNT